MRKDVDCRTTISQIENILAGIGLTYSIIETENNKEMFFSVRIKLNEIQGICSNGKGITYEAALASGLAEMMERLQSRDNIKFWYSTKYPPKEPVYPEYISEENIEQSLISHFENYTKSELYKYRLRYRELESNNNKELPSRLINLICGSNGLCAGNSKEEAMVQGICEIFERYVRKMIVLNKISVFEIDLNCLRNLSVWQYINQFIQEGYDIHVLDLSLGNKFPVVGFLVINSKKSEYFLTLGSDIDFEIAIERCITELLQGRNFSSLTNQMLKIPYSNALFIKSSWDKCNNSNYYSFILNYIMNMG